MTSDAHPKECYVYIVLPGETEFITAARLRIEKTRDSEPIGELVYGKKYLALPNAVEIDPIELKLSDQKYETARMNGMFGALRDAMPDYWGRRVIEKHLGKTGLDEFDYLMLGADDRAGALGFGRNATPPAPKREYNQTLDLERLQTKAEAILNDENLEADAEDEQIQELMLDGTSMGGARPKTVVENEDSLWIAKFTTPHDNWNHPKVEHAFLTLARACRLSTADSKLTTVAGKDVLLVRRFDRDKSETGYRRHRMVSALTLLKSEETPAAKSGWSYLVLADEIRRVSSEPEADLKELFSRIIFNACVSNLDDHPRNHAVLAKDQHWRLSPAYDLTPMPSIAIDNRDLAMTCGLHGRAAKIANIVSGHGRFLLAKDEAEKIARDIKTIVGSEWDAHLRRAGVSDKDCAAIASAKLYAGLDYPIEGGGTHRD